MTTSSRKRHMIVWLDHEPAKVETIINKIGSMKRMTSTNEYLRDCCDFRSVIVKPQATSESIEKFVERAFTRLTKTCEQMPDLVLVDLNFGEHDSPSIDKGRDLALALRQKTYPTQIGVYTAHEIPNLAKTMISADGLLLLEGITRLYEGTSRLMGDDWYHLFDRVIVEARQKSRATPAVLLASPEENSIKWAEGHPLNRSPTFKGIATKLTTLALNWVDPQPEEVTLSQLAGGFSGSFVLKAEITGRRQAYVIKIDENPEKLVQELAGHQRVRSLVGYNYYLPVLSPDMSRPVTLTENWWGAFAMAYDGVAKPLLNHPQLRGKKLAKIYTRLWEECLFDLYGTVSIAEKTKTMDILNEEHKAWLRDGWMAVKRYHSNISVLTGAQRKSLDRVLRWAKSPAGTLGSNKSFDIPTVERVHGDLNCRNVLYNAEKDSFSLIDFPHVGRNYLATDFVKAEAELVLIIMDWDSGRDADFRRLRSWLTLTTALSVGFDVSSGVTFVDPEVKRVFAAIKAVRATYSRRRASSGSPGRPYLLLLLARVLGYLRYEDLTVAKRMLALTWAGQLLAVI